MIAAMPSLFTIDADAARCLLLLPLIFDDTFALPDAYSRRLLLQLADRDDAALSAFTMHACYAPARCYARESFSRYLIC